LKSNPELATFAFRMRAQEARVRQGALRPAPELSVEVENALGTGELKSFDSAEMTFALSQVVELGNKRNARISAAQAGRSVIESERDVRQLDVLAEVTRRFIAVAGRQEQLKLARTATTITEGTVTAAERRVNAARSPHAELDRARIALDRARLEEQRAVMELEVARGQLAASWGESTPTFNGQALGEIRADVFSMPPVGDFTALNARVANNPDLLIFASEARLREAELRLAATLRKPNFSLSVGARHLQATHDDALVASFSIPLFSGRRAESYVAEARAQREQVDADRAIAEVRARSALYELHSQLTQAVREATLLRNEVLPRAEEAMRETQYAYDRGRYSYLELVDAQREFLSLQGLLIDASIDAHSLRTEIERLTNTPAFEAPLNPK
jgi:cobalt-zinc-cadmium efflux system outer membrane protein